MLDDFVYGGLMARSSDEDDDDDDVGCCQWRCKTTDRTTLVGGRTVSRHWRHRKRPSIASVTRHQKTSTPSQWHYTSSEGERLMLETLMESSQGGRRVISQFITMLSVIALPMTAVIWVECWPRSSALTAVICLDRGHLSRQLYCPQQPHGTSQPAVSCTAVPDLRWHRGSGDINARRERLHHVCRNSGRPRRCRQRDDVQATIKHWLRSSEFTSLARQTDDQQCSADDQSSPRRHVEWTSRSSVDNVRWRDESSRLLQRHHRAVHVLASGNITNITQSLTVKYHT